jgi:hypothetical protein
VARRDEYIFTHEKEWPREAWIPFLETLRLLNEMKREVGSIGSTSF